ncbi:MAG: LptA/OstA family protein [Bacteroidota bacterium]
MNRDPESGGTYGYPRICRVRALAPKPRPVVVPAALRMKRRHMFIAFIALVLALTHAFGQAAEEIRAHADRVSGQIKGKGNETIVLEGDVTITQGSTVIQAEKAVYDKDGGSIVLTGGVQLKQKETTVFAEELIYLRRTKDGTFRGGVRLTREEEKDETGKVTKDGFSLNADELVFASEKQSFTAKGHVSMEHKDFSATADEMRYDDEHQELTLTGAPTLTHKDEIIKAEQITISVENDTFRLVKADITFTVEEKDEKAPPAETDAGAATAKDDAQTPPAP